MTDSPVAAADLIELTAEIVSAYVSNNPLQRADLADLIASTHAALGQAASGGSAAPAEAPTPAVSVKKSVNPDYLISLEDGRRYKSLKRHLGRYDMTPEQYRAKWGLPASYPMVAPNYAAQRSQLAKTMGLGRKKADVPAEKPARAPRAKKTAE